MPLASRAALIKRVGSIIGSDRPIPSNWEGLTITERMLIEANDPEAASVLQQRMPADLELAVISGKWAEVAPVVKSDAELRQEAVAAWIEAHPIPTPEEQAAKLRERQMAGEAARQESAMVMNARMAAQARAARGW
jgi:hypothetical protein